MADDPKLRNHVVATLLARVSGDQKRRAEAVREFLLVTLPQVSPETGEKLARLVPPLLPELYAKWVNMFADRLFETVPANQIELLCDGSRKNDASLLLAYVMFLESETMERTMEEDLRAYGLDHSGDDDMGQLVAEYLRARMHAMGREVPVPGPADGSDPK